MHRAGSYACEGAKNAMQILFNNDLANGGQTSTQAEKDSFLADEQTAVNIYNATFTNNITVTLNVGFGSFKGKTLAKQDEVCWKGFKAVTVGARRPYR
jgi:hypothetical protein